MIDPTPTEFVLSPSPTGGVDAKEAFGKVLTGEPAVLLERALLLVSELLESEGALRASAAGDGISVRVLPATRSTRVEIRDEGTGVVVGGLRRHQSPATHGWSPHLLGRIADRWGLVSGADGGWVWFELDLP